MATRLAACALVALAVVGAAAGVWSSTGDGSASGLALTMPNGNTPSVSVTGTDVSVRWPAATFADGTQVAGYIVKRYDANGTPAAVGAACSGVVTSTTCTEHNVPPGSWLYTDTPVQDGWSGGESLPGSPASVS
jgi:hypothetical protein